MYTNFPQSLSPSTSLISTWLSPPGASSDLLNQSIRVDAKIKYVPAFKWIAKLTRLQPQDVFLSLLATGQHCISLSSLNYVFQGHYYIHMIMPSKCISTFTCFKSSCTPLSALGHHLQPVEQTVCRLIDVEIQGFGDRNTSGCII